MKKVNSLTLTVSILLVLVALLLIVLIIPLVFSYVNETEIRDLDDIKESCSGLNIFESSNCVLKTTKNFYKYNLDNIGKTLDFQTLKEEGGVCSSWSDYYDDLGDEFGFNTKNVLIKTSENYHEFNVWSNEEGYCIMDQTKSFCVKF